MPCRASADCTRSCSPTEAPPRVTRRSALARRARRRCRSSSASKRVARRCRDRSASPPACSTIAAMRVGVRGDDLVGAGRLARAGRARRRWRGSRRAAGGARGSAPWPMAAASARRRASSRAPAVQERVARGGNRGRPGGRSGPGVGASRDGHVRRPRASASSWMTIASAPSGHRRAGEDAHRLAGADDAAKAAGRRRSSRSPAGSPGRRRRRRRAPRSRPWRRRGRAAGRAARRGPPRACGRRAAASGTRLGVDRAARCSRARGASASSTGDQAHRALRPRRAPERPPLFAQQADALDPHAAVDRLDHVVDRQAGDRDGGQRLHLDAGLARRPSTSARHADAGQRLVELALDLHLRRSAADGRAGSARGCASPP